jgi:hypothetical protein
MYSPGKEPLLGSEGPAQLLLHVISSLEFHRRHGHHLRMEDKRYKDGQRIWLTQVINILRSPEWDFLHRKTTCAMIGNQQR